MESSPWLGYMRALILPSPRGLRTVKIGKISPLDGMNTCLVGYGEDQNIYDSENTAIAFTGTRHT